MFMSSDNVVKTTVAESLKEKLTAKQTELGSRLSGKLTQFISSCLLQEHDLCSLVSFLHSQNGLTFFIILIFGGFP